MMNPDRKIEIMGIVNLTDDSYYAPSRCLGDDPVSDAMGQVRKMISEGAAIIDFGACSTRPGSHPVGAEQEWLRLEPVLTAFAQQYPCQKFSVDTYHSSVVQNTYELFASIIGHENSRCQFVVNDISAGEDDDRMLPLVGSLGLTYVAMHKRGDSLSMQSLCSYDDVVSEVKGYFENFSLRAEAAGISDWIIDPGFGFAKSLEQNYELLSRLDVLSVLGRPVLVGLSRKSMIYKKLDITPEAALPATQVVHMKALQNGADILRVHDVAEAARTVALYRVLR